MSKQLAVNPAGDTARMIASSLNLLIKEKNGIFYLVADLPEGAKYDRAFVTDANGPTFLGTLTGGGSVTTPVFHNGTAWVAG